jgi:hypothetical protein
VNKFRFTWAALSLLTPLLIFSALCFGPAACSSNNSTTPAASPTAAGVQVGFITNLSGINTQTLQNFFLNVTGVRINPLPNSSKTATPSETSGKWILIPVPTATATGIIPGAVPIDVIAGESALQVFNTTNTTSGKFNTVEVVLDTTTPGFVVPLCAGENLEGCIRYPVQLTNQTSSIRFKLPVTFQTVQHETKLLPILLSANVTSTPSGPGQPYIIQLTASSADSASPNTTKYVGTINGSVTGSSGSTGNGKTHLKVTAELAGTNTVIASSEVRQKVFTLFLPAAADIGTLYDFYISGGNTTLQADRGVNNNGEVLKPGEAAVAFDVKGSQKLGGFAGQVTDSCTQLPISGATLQVLLPPTDASVDCIANPQACVSVATATTDDNGNYPIASTSLNPIPFSLIPIGSPTATYAIQIGAAGYDTLFMNGTAADTAAGKATGHCSTPGASATSTPANGTCNFPLTTGYLTGQVNLQAAQTGAQTTVQVVAENTGTNDLIGALTSPLVFQPGQQNLGFTLNVPTHAFNSTAKQNFDVFAAAEDLYLGGADPFPGHTIVTAQSIPGPATACATASPAIAFPAMDCVGHGSIAGTANNPNSGTTVQLYKGGVALIEAPVGPPTPAPSVGNSYSFCVPPDNYTIQRIEHAANGSPTAAGPTVSVTPMATPMPTNSPCPSTCFSGDGVCPGICIGTTQPGSL